MPEASAEANPTRVPSRSGRALARNSLFNLIGLAAPLLVALFTIPPVIAGLGPERFGVLGLVWVGLAYLGLLDLGLGRATTKYAAEALARGRIEELGAIARSAARVQLLLGVAGGVVVALLVPTLVGDVLHLTPTVRAEARIAFLLMAATAPVAILSNTFRGLLEADQRFALVNAVRTPVSTTNFLLPLAGVWLGWSLGGIVAGMLVVRVIALVAYAGFAIRLWPALRRAAPDERFDRARLLGFGGWVTVSSVVSPLLVYGDRFAIGSLVSVAAVGYYTVPHELVTRLDLVPSALVATLFPAFAAGLAGAAGGDVEGKSVRALKYILCIVGPMLLALAFLADDVLRIWLGAEAAAGSSAPLRLLAVGMIANAAAYVPAALLHAAGRPDITAKFHLIELPIHILLLWLAVGAWGVRGAAAVWAFRVVLDATLLHVATVRLGLMRASAFSRDRLPALGLLLALLALAMWVLVSIIDGRPERIGAVAAAALAWGVVAWIVVLDARERSLIFSAIGMTRRPA